ncbi:MAG TPA: hypothetical protein P5254_15720 [Aquihabitans sp.]|nr:hypothetical protein [Aquihabitans sp.]
MSGDGLGDEAGDPRVQAGVEHLQRAAREVIAASRALLDVAEELVDDPQGVAGLVEALTSAAGRFARPATAPVADAGGADGDDPPVQRIPVS